MKKYIPPMFECVELRIEERLARCSNEPIPDNCRGRRRGHGSDDIPPGNTPGLQYACPAS